MTVYLFRAFQASCAFFPLMGLTWVFGLLAIIPGSSITFQFLFTICNAFQGMFLFIFHFLMDSKVQKWYSRSFFSRSFSSAKSRNPRNRRMKRSGKTTSAMRTSSKNNNTKGKNKLTYAPLSLASLTVDSVSVNDSSLNHDNMLSNISRIDIESGYVAIELNESPPFSEVSLQSRELPFQRQHSDQKHHLSAAFNYEIPLQERKNPFLRQEPTELVKTVLPKRFDPSTIEKFTTGIANISENQPIISFSDILGVPDYDNVELRQQELSYPLYSTSFYPPVYEDLPITTRVKNVVKSTTTTTAGSKLGTKNSPAVGASTITAIVGKKSSNAVNTNSTTTSIPSNTKVALYDFVTDIDGELSLKAGDILINVSKEFDTEGWWTATRLRDNKTGFFPLTYVGDVPT